MLASYGENILMYFLGCKGRLKNDVGVGGKGHRISGVGFKSSDFVERKIGHGGLP